MGLLRWRMAITHTGDEFVNDTKFVDENISTTAQRPSKHNA